MTKTDTPALIATPEEVARKIAIRAARVFVRDVQDGWFLYEETGAGDVLLSRHETEFAARAARDLWIATEAISTLKDDNERLTRENEGLALKLKLTTRQRNQLNEIETSLTETVGKLREALEPFSAFAGELFARNWNSPDVVNALDNPDGDLHRLTAGDFFNARAALSPTEPEAKETTT